MRESKMVTAGLLSMLTVCAIAFSSCASIPSFQENPAEGYTVTDAKLPAMFTVEVRLAATESENFKTNYAVRAVGETCLKRGFDYFNFAAAGGNSWQGYCSKTSANRSLGLTLTVPKKEGEKFIVEHLNNKSRTQVQIGDALLKVNGAPITSMAVLKNEVFASVEAKKNSMQLEIERAGKIMSVDEPIADVANASMGPADLEAVRKIIR